MAVATANSDNDISAVVNLSDKFEPDPFDSQLIISALNFPLNFALNTFLNPGQIGHLPVGFDFTENFGTAEDG